jgi:hypothetical protein
MKRLGPELRMPKLNRSDLKLPPVLVDLYWDLWDRRLLPLIVLVVVAIAAVPFLLGGGSEKPSAPPTAVGTAGGLAAGARSSAATLTVVQAEPGLRDYRKRLGHRSPTDPFKQHQAAPGSASVARLNPMPTTTTTTTKSSGGGSTTVTSTSGTGTGNTPQQAPASPPSEGGEGGGEQHITSFAYAIDVKITRIEDGKNGAKPKTETNTKHKVLPLTPLPGEKAPVVAYMGPSKHGDKPVLLVSDKVKSIFGEGKCLVGGETCQLFEAELGFPVTFAYGENEVRYKINVLKIERVVTGHS